MFPRDAVLTIPNSQHRQAIIAIHINYPRLSRHDVGGYVTCQKEKANSGFKTNEVLASQLGVLFSAESNDVHVVILMKQVIRPFACSKD